MCFRYKKNETVSIRLAQSNHLGSDGPHVFLQINVTKILEWFAPAMANYCRIFDVDCHPDDARDVVKGTPRLLVKQQ